MTEVKIVKQEIKEDNSTEINKQNIIETTNLKYFSRPLTNSPIIGIIMTDPLDPPTDKEVTDINVSNNNKIDSNRQNSLSLIDKVIFQKRDTKMINKESCLAEIALTNSDADNMNCIQERLIPSKYYGQYCERLIQANGEELINYELPNVYICNKGICFEVIKDLSSKVVLRNSFMILIYPFLEIIINLLHEMTLLNNVYKNHGKQDHQIAHLIVTDFTGQLKGWWDHYLNKDDKNQIQTTVKRETDGSVIMIDRQHSQDAVNTLIFTITKHFVGDPNQYKERGSDVLINLRCPQLSNFRWYKDVFISKLLSRNDCQQSYQKENFIVGLPYFLAQNVRLDIANNDGTIDYPSLTYGDIISSINKTGLWLCNDLRLKNQIEKEKRNAKKELGTFCEQYGFDPLIAPSRKRKKEKKDVDRYKTNNRRYNKSRSKEKKEESKNDRPKTN